MSYFISIQTAFIIFPVIAFLITLPYMLIEYRKYGSVHKLRTIIIYSYILYLINIYFLVILPLPSTQSVHISRWNMINYIPFTFVMDFMKRSPLILNDPSSYLETIKHPTFYIPIFNILMTIPFGMYLRYYFKCNFKQTLFYSFLLSLFFELTQFTGLYFIYPSPYRFCDIDDIIQNTFGGILGYALFGLIRNILPSRDEIDEASFEKGKIVSGIRRVLAFQIDVMICTFLSLILFMITHFKYCFYFVFFISFSIIPIIQDGKTLGSSFLRYKITFEKNKNSKTLLRSICMLFFFCIIPSVVFVLLYRMNIYISGNYKNIYLVFYGILLISVFMYYFGTMISFIKDKKMFYDVWLHCIYKSYIKNDSMEDSIETIL